MLTSSLRSSRCSFNTYRTLSTSTKVAAHRYPQWRGPTTVHIRRPARLLETFDADVKGKGISRGTLDLRPSRHLSNTSRPARLLETFKADVKEKAISRGMLDLRSSRLHSHIFRSALDESTVTGALDSVDRKLKDSPLLEGLGLDSTSYRKPFFVYKQAVLDVFHGDNEDWVQRLKRLGKTTSKSTYSKETLQQIHEDGGLKALVSALQYGFYGHIVSENFSTSDLTHQEELADLRYPNEWFPATRTMHRTVHLHVGPTNSGKTYHALKRLEQAESGVYAGPLRLLAHEVYTRLNAKGKRCLLITGEERRSPDETLAGGLSSCTVEMVPLNKTMDVAVIDEIQMMGSRERGWAWTQAFLGLKAKELHVCGEERSIPLIRELAASVGDKLKIHRYERLSPLKVMDHSLNGSLKGLEKGDCVVSFSVFGIHTLRREIEKVTGKKVAIVYGSLPPETRAQQARLFNDPDNDYDFLVASDAIGMGLNLSIKRIIFEATSKRRGGGGGLSPLTVAEVKQIAGRAGRYRTAAQDVKQERSEQEQPTVHANAEVGDKGQSQGKLGTQDGSISGLASPSRLSSTNVGYVTTLEQADFPFLRDCMNSDPEPITSAGLFPPGPIVERFTRYFPPGTPFSYIMLRLHETAKLHTRFHLCELKDQLGIADAIQPVKGLTTVDRIIFCAAPVVTKGGDLSEIKLIRALATCVEQQRGGGLLDIEELPLDVLDKEPSTSREYLGELERLHKGIILYLWLGYRFSGVFNTQTLAMHVKGLVEAAIEKALAEFSFSMGLRRKLLAKREQKMIRYLIGGRPRDAEAQLLTSEATVSDGRGERGRLDGQEKRRDNGLDLAADGPAGGGEPVTDPKRQRDAHTESTSFTEWHAAQRQNTAQTGDEDVKSDVDGDVVNSIGLEADERTKGKGVGQNLELYDSEVDGELDDGLEDLSDSVSQSSSQTDEQIRLPVSDDMTMSSAKPEKDPGETIRVVDRREHDGSFIQDQMAPR
ncbi:hypothetical protein EV356DRAFT_572956 [Viridothelium virens]|uniref:RNA helicase n=1 Tax=Viridothelium virens TaxID=1048519 RepID=A0A6A6HM24_VIRVR|nr:hypothetical protein EV356DRAFT_572956 [Viridothelium virens]